MKILKGKIKMEFVGEVVLSIKECKHKNKIAAA
jgi:hypothetical protein